MFNVNGATVSASHIWDKNGDYTIKVIAEDELGCCSEWSGILSVTMPKNKAINIPFLRFLEQHLVFPILRQLLGL